MQQAACLTGSATRVYNIDIYHDRTLMILSSYFVKFIFFLIKILRKIIMLLIRNEMSVTVRVF